MPQVVFCQCLRYNEKNFAAATMEAHNVPRTDGRESTALRPFRITKYFQQGPQGSALIEMGKTKVLCAATVEDHVPNFLRGTGTGWLRAEYSLLPSATSTRTPREAARGKQSGRTQEIQRLIGRSLRAVTDTSALGERTLILDCDVIQADGGTRTASVTGSFIALVLACETFYQPEHPFPVKDFLAAVSVGLSPDGTPILDLCYEEDSHAAVDMNVVMTGAGQFVEIQGTGEGRPFTRSEHNRLLDLAADGIDTLISYQKDVLGNHLDRLIGRIK